MLLLYSDGLTEQKYEAAEEYGFDRLRNFFARSGQHCTGNM
jgi:serine phosphatase RsbU (regulator of sigma subunit)